MPKGNTTIKVSRRIVKYLESRAQGNESIDTILRRLMGLGLDGAEPPKQPTSMTIIKISRPVMDKILKEAKEEESRDETLSRLLGLPRRVNHEHKGRQHSPRGSVRDPG
jgi:hypothetical protein